MLYLKYALVKKGTQKTKDAFLANPMDSHWNAICEYLVRVYRVIELSTVFNMHRVNNTVSNNSISMLSTTKTGKNYSALSV